MNLETLHKEIIGSNRKFHTPYGERVITYADYTASGKPLGFLEKYMNEISEFYANTHTEDDVTGEYMTKLLHQSEKIIKKELNASDNCYVIPAGTGATGAILSFSKIVGVYLTAPTKVRLMDFLLNSELSRNNDDYVKEIIRTEFVKKMPVVFVGAYEHHSNILIWRESLAEVVEIGLDKDGYLNLDELEEKVSDSKYENRMKIGSFSAASNVTGIKTDVYRAARILHRNNALACFDFAASAPYVEINMNKSELEYFDAVYFSPHKFIGGPGTSGILVLNSAVYDSSLPPTVPGGGTVDYVSSFGQDYTSNVEEREKAGTPGILQIIKAGLAIQLKGEIGTDVIEEREERYTGMFFDRLADNPDIEILGPLDPKKRLSIISFMIKYKDKYLHHRFITKLMNDLFGIQSRAGCACAGPYGHSLLGIGEERSTKFRDAIKKGVASLKPGWVRLNLHYSMHEKEVEFIIDAVEFISRHAYLFVNDYTVDLKSGGWVNNSKLEEDPLIKNFGVKSSLKFIGTELAGENNLDKEKLYNEYLTAAEELSDKFRKSYKEEYSGFDDESLDRINWFYFSKSENGSISI